MSPRPSPPGRLPAAGLLAPLLLCADLGACSLPASNNGAYGWLTTPGGGTVEIECSNIIDFQSDTASLSGLQITLPVATVAGSPTITLGSAYLDQQTTREASDLIEALDNAQLMSCKAMLLVAPADRYKVLLDYNTEVVVLTTLLRNLNNASSTLQATAAITTAANQAITAAGAAVDPPAPATPSQITGLAGAPATAQSATDAVAALAGAAATMSKAAGAIVPGLASGGAPTAAAPKTNS